MRGLSIQQPWLGAIVCGDKRVENRTWPAPPWVIGKTIALHASKQPDWHASPRAWAASGLAPCPPRGGRRSAWAASLTLGAVMAVATVAGCHPRYHICNPAGPVTVCSPWAVWGQCHWILEDVRPLADPVPCGGARGLWPLPDDVEAAVREQTGGATPTPVAGV